MDKAHLLIVDDDVTQAETLGRVLELEGYRATVADGARQALLLMEEGEVDLVLTDLKMPGIDGLQLFRQIKQRWPDMPVMVVTAHATIDTAIQAVREGVADFIQRPVYAEELIHRFSKVLDARATRRENEELKRRLLHRDRGDAMIGTSAAMARLRGEISRVGRTDASVLILGEPGVGKELVADAIHYASGRADGPFLKINCDAIPDTLLEDELFGHERGAYTGANRERMGRFELAAGGTLLLDEIGGMPLPLQAKLLRVLQEHRFERLGGTGSIEADVRVICATNQDLDALVRDGKFRRDLYQRIAVVPITVPPLRERADDAVLLARHFARDTGRRHGREIDVLTREAEDAVRRHRWPGNVRELRDVIERGVISGTGGKLQLEDLSLGGFARSAVAPDNGDALVSRLMHSQITFEQFERELLVQALHRTRGNQSRAARMLGMTRRTLQYRIDKFDIDTAPMRT